MMSLKNECLANIKAASAIRDEVDKKIRAINEAKQKLDDERRKLIDAKQLAGSAIRHATLKKDLSSEGKMLYK